MRASRMQGSATTAEPPTWAWLTAAFDWIVTSLFAPRFTSKPSAAVPGQRSHVVPSKHQRNEPMRVIVTVFDSLSAGVEPAGRRPVSVASRARAEVLRFVPALQETVPLVTVTSLLVPRFTRSPSAELPGQRSQVVPSKHHKNEPIRVIVTALLSLSAGVEPAGRRPVNVASSAKVDVLRFVPALQVSDPESTMVLSAPAPSPIMKVPVPASAVTVPLTGCVTPDPLTQSRPTESLFSSVRSPS